jgi:hypothetical protein
MIEVLLKTKHQKVKKISSLIRETFGIYPQMGGGCYKFHLILKEVFPWAQCYYNSNHVITRIGLRYYDINGEVKPTKQDNYLHIDNYGGYKYMNKIFYNL